ncbi:hypothetical protein PV10_01239 [Exophiala mesophila]|uniref:Alpha box domain-containing protein n=1 Tax=Exophiala mesophila TaxID=212818 RepID=A0A0D1ZU97_EXOME|nr:uncharacterized protein PV10_01239 [Exophiala mesophila]KIV97489.1 hypothetical protein PV10_01239 [Exophiala mesophila]
MAATKAQLQATLSAIFENLTEAQLNDINKTLATLTAQNSKGLAADAMQPKNANKVSKPAARVLNSRGKKKTKRVLNGFICFRSYYGSVFKGKQMDKSGLLREMWAKEPRRNLFGLLGKAFSDLRDGHSESVSLEKFLETTIPLLPVVPADQYLVKMGWTVTTNEGKDAIRRVDGFDAAATNLEFPPQTNVSVHELVEHCYKQGLVDRDDCLSSTESAQSDPWNSLDYDITFATAPVPQQDFAEGVATTPEFETDAETNYITSAQATPSSVSSDHVPEGYLTIGAVTADQQAAYDQLEFGYHFHPDMEPVLGFDPRIIQDDFDPFDLDVSELFDFGKSGYQM